MAHYCRRINKGLLQNSHFATDPYFLLCDICFLGQSDADFDTFLKAGFFVVTAESTDRVDNLIHFPEGFAVHEYSALPEPGVRRLRATVPMGQSQCSGR